MNILSRTEIRVLASPNNKNYFILCTQVRSSGFLREFDSIKRNYMEKYFLDFGVLRLLKSHLRQQMHKVA